MRFSTPKTLITCIFIKVTSTRKVNPLDDSSEGDKWLWETRSQIQEDEENNIWDQAVVDGELERRGTADCGCVEYQGLNTVTLKDCTPLPLISETLDRLASSTCVMPIIACIYALGMNGRLHFAPVMGTTNTLSCRLAYLTQWQLSKHI